MTLTVGTENAREIADGRMYIVHITESGNVIYGAGHEPIEADVDGGTVTFTADSFSPFVLAKKSVSYYGRSALEKLPNSTALLYAYDKIAAGVAESKAEISVYNGTNPISYDELMTAYEAYRFDHTEHFWLGIEYTVGSVDGTATTLKPSYIMSGAELDAAKAEFDNACRELLSGIDDSMSEYEREKTLHDRLAAKVSYDPDADNAHNAYGAIVEGRAVCEGYAEAYQYLLQLAGLQSFIVTGTSANPSTGRPEGHAWNIVRVDGRYYHVDLTWDDQGETIFYAYFNKTDDAIKADHVISDTVYELPVCRSEEADYFTVNGGKMGDFDAEAVGTAIKNGGGKARIYVTGNRQEFINAFIANIRTVGEYAGVSGGFSYGYSALGNEIIFTVLKTGYKVSGTVTSFGNAGNVKVELIPSGASNAKYTVTVTGNSADYAISDVEAGTYTLRVSKSKHAAREYIVTVGTSDVTQDAEIWLYGDVNRDGKVDNRDATQINLYSLYEDSIFDYGTESDKEYRLKVANVTGITLGDNNVDNRDAAQINLYSLYEDSIFDMLP